MMNLRPYQIESVTELRKGFKDHQRQLLCLTTGAGKTVVFSEIVRLSSHKGTQCLILTDRIELFEQTFKSIERTGITAQVLNANTRTFCPDKLVTVSMVETISRRDTGTFNPKLIIIDEAHKGNFTKIIDRFPEAKVIGATATPVGKHLYQYYTNLVQTIDTPDLIQSGYLSPCHAYQMQDDFSDLVVKRGEYTEQSLFGHFNNDILYGGVIDKWKEFTPNKKTIVFNVNIEHTQEMTKRFNEAGITSFCVTSKTPKHERDAILSSFSKGEFMVLNNCGILTTGYDEPSIEVVIMNRKTKSLPLWLQCCGRGSRVYPNKNHFTVLDFGQNHAEHGLWEMPRTWELKAPKKKKEQAAPVKECPECYAMNYASAKECVVCGFVYPQKEKEETEKNGVLVRVVPSNLIGKRLSQLTEIELAELQKTKKYKASFIWRVVRSQSMIHYYAKIMGYSNGWIYRQEQEVLFGNVGFKDYEVRG